MGILVELDDDAAALLMKAQAEEIERLKQRKSRSEVARKLQSISMSAVWAKKKARWAAVTARPAPVFMNGHADEARLL